MLQTVVLNMRILNLVTEDGIAHDEHKVEQPILDDAEFKKTALTFFRSLKQSEFEEDRILSGQSGRRDRLCDRGDMC